MTSPAHGACSVVENLAALDLVKAAPDAMRFSDAQRVVPALPKDRT